MTALPENTAASMSPLFVLIALVVRSPLKMVPECASLVQQARARPISYEALRAYRVPRDGFPRLPGQPNASPARPASTRWPTRRLATDVLPEQSRGKSKACTRVRISRPVSLVKDSSVLQTRSHRVVRRRVRIVRRVSTPTTVRRNVSSAIFCSSSRQDVTFPSRR